MWRLGLSLLMLASTPEAIVREFDRMADKQLWPGFDARAVPLAVYDGTQTVFFRHPKLREPYAGQHPAVRANTSVEIDGAPTATLIVGNLSATTAAAVLVHEAFHVYQQQRYPSWKANEAAMFTYPQEDAELLALARLESEALRRAVAASETKGCWAARAADIRRSRFSKMPKDAVDYERGTELKEGTARYVQSVAEGNTRGSIPEGGYEQLQVRGRAYATGEAWALILDRIRPDWKSEVATSLDELVTAKADPGCNFTDAETKTVRAWARSEASRVIDRQLSYRSSFFARSGWVVTVIASEKSPLVPAGFDPMNVELVSPKEVLHRRWVKLANDSGSLEALDRSSLTVAAGTHPLFSGIREWTAVGFPAEPRMTTTDGVTRVTAAGIAIEFRGARVERADEAITIRLP
jgi:hypothetical protein